MTAAVPSLVATPPVPAPRHATRDVPSLLAAHVPLSLLLDLADPLGPHSDDLLVAEPGCSDWLHGEGDPGRPDAS